MNNKKIIIIVLIMTIIISLIIFLTYIFNDNYLSLQYKINRIEKLILNDIEDNPSKEKYQVFISVSDSNSKAYVQNGNGSSLTEAIHNTEEKLKNVIKENNIEPQWVRVDIVNGEEKIKYSELQTYISRESEMGFRKGIAFSDNYEIALLETELNANNIINYVKDEIRYENLNSYLNTKNKGNKANISAPDEVIIFDCISYISDENGTYKLRTEENSFGRREEDICNKENLKRIITNASNYLKNSVKENGSFVYEYDISDKKESSSYNILRHEGTAWSMLQAYSLSNDEELKKKIDLSIQYIVENALVYKNENEIFVLDAEENELKLGANGIGILLFVEYMKEYNSTDYEDIIIKMGNAILEMQNEDGSYYHVYSYPDFEEKDEFRTVYYDGEATYGLIKLYEYTKDKKWLDAAERSMDYFVEENYEKYRDQWIEYSVSEIVEYLPKKEYFELGLKNVTKNYEEIISDSDSSPTNLELITTGIKIYDKAIQKNIDVSNYNINLFTYAIQDRANYQLNFYLYAEKVMYYDEPSKILYAFYTNDRIRIDDVQHNINAYYAIYQNYDVIQKYRK